MTRVIALNQTDQEFTGYFAAALIATFREEDEAKLRAGVREFDPSGEVVSASDLPLLRGDKLREMLLSLRFAHYVERLSADGLPKMVTASWIDFATTVVEALPERERGMVWDYLDQNEAVMRDLRGFLEPALAKLKYGWEKMQNGGVPPLSTVAA